MTVGATRFPIRYGRLRWLLIALGLGPSVSGAEIGERDVHVRMGWAFSAEIPRASVTSAKRDKNMRWGVGVHGGRGRWLVNGSTTGIVTLTIDPPVRARLIVVSVRLRTLHVSMVDPDAFAAALRAPWRAGA